MRQRKRKALLAAALAAVMVLVCVVVWLCLPRGYERLVPAQAKAVVRIEPARLQQRLGGASPLASSWGLSAKGLDMQKPVYLFITPNEYVGLAAAVDDDDAFAAQIEGLVKQGKCAPVEHSDGRSWAWLEAGWMLTWDGHSLLALGPGMATERDILRQTMSRMMDGGQPFTSTKTFDKMVSQGGDAQLFAQLDALPAPYNMLFRLGVPPTCDPAAVQLFANISLTKGAGGHLVTEIQSQMGSDNADIAQALAQYERGKQCIERIPQAVADSALFVMATSTQGKPLLEMLRTDPTLRGLLMALAQTIDSDRLLGTANGLFTIEIASLGSDWTPAFCVKAENHTQGLLSDADYWLESAVKQPGVSLDRRGPNDFSLTADKRTVEFGVLPDIGAVYFASAGMSSAARHPWLTSKSRASGSGLLTCFSLNLQKFFAQPCMRNAGAAAIIKQLLPGTKRLTYEAHTGGKAVLRIE